MALRRKHFFNLFAQRVDLCQRRRDQLGRYVAFVREINSGFNQRRGVDDLRTPMTRPLAEHPLQLAQRLAALPVGVGMNQIVERLRLGQIELAILERAPGKLTRFRGAYMLKGRERREQRCQDGNRV